MGEGKGDIGNRLERKEAGTVKSLSMAFTESYDFPSASNDLGETTTRED